MPVESPTILSASSVRGVSRMMYTSEKRLSALSTSIPPALGASNLRPRRRTLRRRQSQAQRGCRRPHGPSKPSCSRHYKADSDVVAASLQRKQLDSFRIHSEFIQNSSPSAFIRRNRKCAHSYNRVRGTQMRRPDVGSRADPAPVSGGL